MHMNHHLMSQRAHITERRLTGETDQSNERRELPERRWGQSCADETTQPLPRMQSLDALSRVHTSTTSLLTHASVSRAHVLGLACSLIFQGSSSRH
jgi:hypothetical protein